MPLIENHQAQEANWNETQELMIPALRTDLDFLHRRSHCQSHNYRRLNNRTDVEWLQLELLAVECYDRMEER